MNENKYYYRSNSTYECQGCFAKALGCTLEPDGSARCKGCLARVAPLCIRALDAGRAAFAAGFSPDEAIIVKRELDQASRGLVIDADSNHLHGIFL